MPGTLDGINDALGGIPGAKQDPKPGGVTVTTLPDGTQVTTYPGRKSSNFGKPGFNITKPGQKDKRGIKGTITAPEKDDIEAKSDDKTDTDKNGSEANNQSDARDENE